MENNKKNDSISFIDALLALSEELRKSLGEKQNSVFNDLFPSWKQELDNSIKELNNIKKPVELSDEEKKKFDGNVLTNSHAEISEDGDVYEYSIEDSTLRTHDEVITIIKKKLADYTFAACTDDKHYILKFKYNTNNINFKFVEYNFEWNNDILHFVGTTTDTEFELAQDNPPFVFNCDTFYYDEVKDEFVLTEDKRVKKIEVKNVDEEECDKKCLDEPICNGNCGKEAEEKSYIKVYTADSLFNKINNEANETIENEVLPVIKTGVDKVFDYKMYTIDRTGNNSYFDIVVFNLEDVRNLCSKRMKEFWNIIPYETLVKFFVETYEFKKVLILEKRLEDNTLVHEVRCYLK